MTSSTSSPTVIGRRLVLAACLALGVAGRAPAAEIVVPHASGQTTLEAPPKTVLVYDLAALDILDALGVPVAGVPGGAKPAYLEKYQGSAYRKIGTLFEPDYEAVNAAAPDLVIVGGRSRAKYEALAKIARTIDLTAEARDPMGSAARNTEILARIFGTEKEAEALLASLRTDAERVKAKAASAGTALVILTTGGRMSAYGLGSRFGILHDVLGFKPAATDLEVGVHGQPISFEFIAKTNPDWLFVIDRDAALGRQGQPAQQFLDNELVRGTKAWSAKRVVYLDAPTWYLVGDGLSALKATFRQIDAALDAAR